jgi:hypothetical protein
MADTINTQKISAKISNHHITLKYKGKMNDCSKKYDDDQKFRRETNTPPGKNHVPHRRGSGYGGGMYLSTILSFRDSGHLLPPKNIKMTVSAPPFPSVFKRDSIPPPHGKPGYSPLTRGEFLAWWYFERLVVLCGSSHICFQKP